MRTAKQIEDAQRWTKQEKDRIANDLTEEELKDLLMIIEKRKTKSN
jgi:hypothetical protein